MTASSTRTSRADDYAAAVAALTSRGRFGISLGLERVEAILDELGHPERSLRGALVGGTNGKGSVVAMARSVLGAAGLRVGTMPKPHLVSYRERIAIDGRPLDEARFARAVDARAPRRRPRGRAARPADRVRGAHRRRLRRAGRHQCRPGAGRGGHGRAPGRHQRPRCRRGRHHQRPARSRALPGPHPGRHRHREGGHHQAGQPGRDRAPPVGACGPSSNALGKLGVPLSLVGPEQAYRATLRDAGWNGLRIDLARARRRAARRPHRPAGKPPGRQCGGRAGGARCACGQTLHAGARRSTRYRRPRFVPDCATCTGRGGWSCCRARPSATCCSTGRTIRRAPARSLGPCRSWGCAASRWCSAPCAASASRTCWPRWPRWIRSPSSRRWTTRAPAPHEELLGAWQAGGGGRGRATDDPRQGA